MTPLLVALQLVPAPAPAQPPPAYAPPPATAPARPGGQQSPAGSPPAPGSAQPAGPQQFGPPQAAGPPAPSEQSDLWKERDEVSWFARIELGVGTRGFAENNALLDEVGYASTKMWATMDVAWMAHRHIGIGLWMGMNRRSSETGNSGRGLNAAGYFIGGEAPILLWGKRAYAFHLTPRVGFLAGQLDITGDVDFTGSGDEEKGDYQYTAIFGGGVGFQTFTYHLGFTIGFLHAPAGPPGELGRDHDYGGLNFMLGGTIDG